LRRLCHCEALLAILALGYVALSIVVYTDFPREASGPPLDDLERRGLSIWRGNNCQSCHQLYGFGGFLGPDLTNRVTDRTPDDEFRAILSDGARQMPAFELADEQQEAVIAFLRAVNRSGQSQPEPLTGRPSAPAIQQFAEIADEWVRQGHGELHGDARRGLEVFTSSGCGVCHVPFTRGLMRAPDLASGAIDKSVDNLSRVLTNGQRNMPPFELGTEDVASLSHYLSWATDNRRDLVRVNAALRGHAGFSWRALPWFEYR